MTPEIKKLLKLSSIPGFKLSKKEEQTLAEWKSKQEPVKVKKPRKKVKNVIEKTEKILNEES